MSNSVKLSFLYMIVNRKNDTFCTITEKSYYGVKKRRKKEVIFGEVCVTAADVLTVLKPPGADHISEERRERPADDV